MHLSRYGAESPVTQSWLCSAKPGPRCLHSGFASRPAAVEYFNQSQSEIFKTTVLPSWHICFLFRFVRIMTHAQCFQVKAPHSLCSLSSSTQRFPPQNPCPRQSRTHPGEGRKGGAHYMRCPAPREPPPRRQMPVLGRCCWGWEDKGRSCLEPGLDLTPDPSRRRSRGNAQHPCICGFFFF